MRSFIYLHPKIYEYVMKLLHLGDFKKRYEIISQECRGMRILDLCCGDCYLSNFVDKKRYTGIDLNKTFIRHALKKGINAKFMDIEKEEIPESECIILQGSLYQFIPNEAAILEKIFNKATKKVIISEPIHNLADSRLPFVKKIAAILTKTEKGKGYSRRFNEKNLRALFRDYGVNKIIKTKREFIGVFYVRR